MSKNKTNEAIKELLKNKGNTANCTKDLFLKLNVKHDERERASNKKERNIT